MDWYLQHHRKEAMSDQICMIIDLEGFFVNGQFQARELGYYTHTQDFGRIAFYQKKTLKNINEKDKKTIFFCKKNIHGLTYQPRKEEKAVAAFFFPEMVRDLYEKYKTESKPLVAFKGGNIERKILSDCGIPNLDLEYLGCPTFNILKSTYQPLIDTCRFHQDPEKNHCAMVECETFWNWLQKSSP